VRDPGPRPQQDVFFSCYLIVTNSVDLGKGSSPPQTTLCECVFGCVGLWTLPAFGSFPEAFVLCQFDTYRIVVLKVSEGTRTVASLVLYGIKCFVIALICRPNAD
jgi:hypothetical protein